MGQAITIDGGSQLLALATAPGGKNGTIKITAVDNAELLTGVPALGNAVVNINKANVTIGNATIKGGDVEITATTQAKDVISASDFGTIPGLSSILGTGVNAIISALKNIAFEVQVAYSESDSIIHIGEAATDPATTILADNFTAYAKATATPSAAPISLALIGAAAAVGEDRRRGHPRPHEPHDDERRDHPLVLVRHHGCQGEGERDVRSQLRHRPDRHPLHDPRRRDEGRQALGRP